MISLYIFFLEQFVILFLLDYYECSRWGIINAVGEFSSIITLKIAALLREIFFELLGVLNRSKKFFYFSEPGVSQINKFRMQLIIYLKNIFN